MESPPAAPSELLARIAESTFTTVGLDFILAAGRLINAAWGTSALFVSEADEDDPDCGQVLLAPAHELRQAEFPDWTEARGAPWFLPPTQTKSFGTSLPGEDEVLQRLQAEWSLTIRLESRSTPGSAYIGLIDSRTADTDRAAAAEALLRLIAPRAVAEMERDRIADAASARGRALRHLGATLKEGILVWSRAGGGTVEYANGVAQHLLGKNVTDVRGDASGVLARLSSLPRTNAAREGEYAGAIAVSRDDDVLTTITAQVLGVASTHGTVLYYAVLNAAGELEHELLTEDSAPVSTLRMVAGRKTGLILSTRGEVTLMSARAAEMLGVTDRARAADARILVCTDGEGGVSMALGDCLRELEQHREAERLLHIDLKHGERFLELRSHTLTVAGSTRLAVVVVDSTVRERRLRELERRTRIYESVPASFDVGMLALDAEGKVTWVSDQWITARADQVEQLRWATGLQVGDDFIRSCQDAADAGSAVARDLWIGVAGVLRGSTPRYTADVLIDEDRHDIARAFFLYVTAVPDGHGAVFGAVETTGVMRLVRDAQIEAENARGLLANLPLQVARLSPNGDLVQLIGPALRAPGVALFQSGAVKRNIRELLPADAAEQLLEAARESMRRNLPVVSTILVNTDEAERTYEVRIVPSERDVVLTLVDRTGEEHAMEHEPDSAPPLLTHGNPYDLTFREVSVLELMAEGASDKEIAMRLGVSVFTVNKHVSKVLHKMDAASRTEASMRAVRESLVNR